MATFDNSAFDVNALSTDAFDLDDAPPSPSTIVFDPFYEIVVPAQEYTILHGE
ncbi:MAG TPA: hypothetical protein VGE27_12910 [Gemmatimonas sp.]|uniref:hypothetical protein n=1 Tax=Gemmatimonas sp. TaxID=1962908 RepID=UPI002EDAAE2A